MVVKQQLQQLVANTPSQSSSLNSVHITRLLPLLALPSSISSNPILPRRQLSLSLRSNETRKLKSIVSPIRSQASNVGVGSSNYDGREESDGQDVIPNDSSSESSSQSVSPIRSQTSNIGVGSSNYDGREESGSQDVIPNDSSSESSSQCPIRSQTSNIGVGSSNNDGRGEFDSQDVISNDSSSEPSSQSERRPSRIPYPLSIAMVLSGCALVFSLIMFVKGGPSTTLEAIAKTGFTAAFTLISVSEIGDKTFFIAALLAMQYKKGLVLLGSMGALSLMSILSVIIGRVFQSVPAQFQTTLPIGEYAAVTLLLFFGLKSIKDAWELPPESSQEESKDGSELGEYSEAEELVKEKASKKLTNPLDIVWKSFSLVFFAEWGDRSMLATIALGAAQSPWGVASGAIMGHLVATSVAILGGAFLAKYISEKLVGYVGGALFLLFAVATFFGFF